MWTIRGERYTECSVSVYDFWFQTKMWLNIKKPVDSSDWPHATSKLTLALFLCCHFCSSSKHKKHKKNSQKEGFGFISVHSAIGPKLCSCCSWFRYRAGFPCQWGEGSEAIKACCLIWVVGSNGWLLTTCPVGVEAAAWPFNFIDLKGPARRPPAVTRLRPLTSDQHGAKVKGNAYWIMAVWSWWCTGFLNNVTFRTKLIALHFDLRCCSHFESKPFITEHSMSADSAS